jgi:outer membrane lipopolysaccharide assembly protein LptE/RlpB
MIPSNGSDRRIFVNHCPPRAFLGFLLFLAALLLAGCGYSFRGNLPAHIKTVAVPIFKNTSQAPGIENVVTSAVVTAFSNGGRLRVVPVEQADSILTGEIVGYAVEGVSFDRNSNVQAYRLRVVLNVEFRDLRQHKTLWQEKALTQISDFQVLGQASDTIAREGGAASQAAADIGRKIVNSAVDLF